jgi:hypothetical protein
MSLPLSDTGKTCVPETMERLIRPEKELIDVHGAMRGCLHTLREEANPFVRLTRRAETQKPSWYS